MNKIGKRLLSTCLAVLTLMSCWVWMAPEQSEAAAADAVKDHYLFAYFTGTSKEGQTIHLAVSEDGYHYTALRNNEPVLLPSKGVGNVRDPYIWYNEQDNYYYILATDLDFTDGGGTYSNNSQSFIIWRSEDLVTWHDETMIDVSKMAHLIGDTRGMTAVWAPQVLWDGSAYVVYFTLACNATSWFDIVYLKTTDLLDPNAYYEFDYILGNSTGNGVCDTYGVIDADIIHNPGDGKYYLFYKTECNANELGTTNKGTSLKTIHYYVGDTPTGPFRNPGDTKWTDCGFSVFPNYNVSLEGCNSFFDNDGNLIMYVDEFEHTNVDGVPEAYFHIAKSNGYDFTSWSYPSVGSHNINSLSPRHGSVVKITEAEYDRLLENSYAVSSSSFPMNEELEDHLVARYFTNSDVADNAVVGRPGLTKVSGITMEQNAATGAWWAKFAKSYAEIDLDDLFLDGLNYDDGFTVTFKAKFPSANVNDDNARFFDITTHQDMTGRTGVESYIYLSPTAEANGAYVCAYNGPGAVEKNVDVTSQNWNSDPNMLNRADDTWHEYMVSSANGNIMVWIDGYLTISINRFTSVVPFDDRWYKTIGDATLLIGKSAYVEGPNDPLFTGFIRDFCLYDCSMSYYDIKNMDAKMKASLGWIDNTSYQGIQTKIPTFSNADATQMSTATTTATNGIVNYNPSEHYGNILYTKPVSGTPSGNDEQANPSDSQEKIDSSAIVADLGTDGNFKFGIYYSHNTVLLYDGVNDAKMPVMLAGRINKNDYGAYLNVVYPIEGTYGTADNKDLKLQHPWYGWTSNDRYHETVKNLDGTSYRIGYSLSTVSGYEAWFEDTDSIFATQKDRRICYYANTLKVDDSIDFNGESMKTYNLAWRVKGLGHNDTFDVNTISLRSTIYVINYKAILDLRETITEEEYNSIMQDDNICPTVKERYALAVYTINTLNPYAYDFSSSEIAANYSRKNLARAIDEAISTYNGVKTAVDEIRANGTEGGHIVVDLAAREATCSVNGLTHGSYCKFCGEVFEEQQPTATLPHTFGDVFTEDGIEYRECSVCGVRLEYKPYELRYENLFALNRWDDSASNGVFNGTVSTHLKNGTITIVNNHTTEIYTRATYDGQNLVSTRDFGNDCIPVEGGRTYVVEATSLSSSTSNGDVFVFQYNKDGLAYQAIPAVIGNLMPGENRAVEFTVDSNAAYIELRFDANDAGKTITYSEIGVYEKENYDRFGSDTANSRLAFYPGDSKELAYPNPSDGYTFDGWYTVAGKKIENINQLNNSTTLVYGKWIPAGYNIVYDSIFSFSSWAKSSCNQLWYGDQKDASGNVTRLVHKSEGIVADAENGTLTITNDADTNYFARTNYWVDTGNLHKMTVKQNTDYIIEYTASSDDGAKPNVCAYITGGTPSYPESSRDKDIGYALGRQFFKVSTENNTTLTLRFDNVQHGSTLTYSGIAVYEAAEFQEAARTITNREYLRYYPQKMGIGDVFEYIPERPGYTFENWWAHTSDIPENDVVSLGDFNMKNLDDAFVVSQNWHLFSEWTENEYTVNFNYNGGSGSVSSKTVKYTEGIELPSEGVSRKGYKLLGWSPVDIDKPLTQTAPYALSATPSRLNGDQGGETTLYAVWWNNVYNMTFDNLVDFKGWNKVAGNGTVSDVTETGFTVTCNDGAGEATSASPFFAVEPGKQYKIDIDITGTNWDVYIFFCNESGGWVGFQDSTNRYSSDGGGVSSRIFTAPTDDTVVKAQIRVDANGSNNAVTFDNIRVYEYKLNEINYSDNVYRYQEATYDEAYPDTFVPTREGYDFNGWFNSGMQYYTNKAKPTKDLFQHDYTFKLFSQWQLNGKSLTPDSYVADFGATIEVDPIKNDQIFLNEAKNSNNSSYTVSVETAGASASSNIVSYKPSSIFNEITKIPYFAQLAQGDYSANKVSNTISVIPASNILYEENVLTTDTTGKAQWGTYGTAGNTAQTDNSVYGYDALYDNANDFSNGSAKKTTVSSSANRSETLTFTFTGTGFELYGACGTNTGVQVIAVRDAAGNLKKSAIVDTFYSDNNYGTLYQTPIYNISGLPYGTYTVEVTAAYLSFAGALQTQSADTFSTLSTNDNELADALADVGLDYILEADDVDVEWFDDDSILNGGTGANDPTSFGTYADMPLDNYVDAVRVFEPLNKDDSNYIDSEKKARYYNINDNLMSASNFITGSSGFVYVEGQEANDRFEIGAADYNKKGSKHEVYLANGNSQALTFTVANVGNYSRVMLSLRSATGAPVTVKIGKETVTVNSKTDMYYDITDAVAPDGTVTIQNETAGSLLAVGYLKLTGDATFETTSDLSTAIDMIETPIDIEDTESGSITNVEYTPSTDSHNSFDVTVNGRPAMIQFIEEDGGTRTYDRNNKNVVIKSYNADGVQVNSLDRTVAYEIWTINTNLTGPDVKVRAKYLADGKYSWEKNHYSFTYEILEPEIDADVKSITPASQSGPKGPVSVKVVTGPDAQGVRFVMPDGSTATYYTQKAVVLEDGNLEFTGKAWMNNEGLNTVTVKVRVNGAWVDAGTIEYTVE